VIERAVLEGGFRQRARQFEDLEEKVQKQFMKHDGQLRAVTEQTELNEGTTIVRKIESDVINDPL
jgi:hypothetical protein